MLRLLKELLLFTIALIGVIFIAPIVFIVKLFYKFLTGQDIASYLHTISIGLDQLGGSVLYEQEDWTISSYTYFLCTQGNKLACKFEKFINFFAGKEHCKHSFYKEKHDFEKEIKLRE